MRPSISIRGFVPPSVGPSIGPSVDPSRTLSLKRCEIHLMAGIGTCLNFRSLSSSNSACFVPAGAFSTSFVMILNQCNVVVSKSLLRSE